MPQKVETHYNEYSAFELIKKSVSENVDNNDNANINRNLRKKIRAKAKRKEKRRKLKKKKGQAQDHRKGCKIMYTNADSIMNKKAELFTRIELEKPDIIAITETKSKTIQENDSIFDIPNFDKFENSNPQRGVVIYINSAYNARKVDRLNSHSYQEGVWCSFDSKENFKVLVGCIYRSPNSKENNNSRLSELLTSAEIKRYDKVCIMGDFNFPKLKWDGTDIFNQNDDKESKETIFSESLRDAYLIQNVCKPTRNREAQKANILDLVLTNEDDLISTIVHSDPLGLSDHQVLTFHLIINMEDDITTFKHRYNLHKGDYHAMRKEAEAMDWSQLYIKNLNEMWEGFSQTIKESMEKNIPKTKIASKRRLQPSWMSKKALRKIKKKYKLFKRFLETNSGAAYRRYIVMRDKCKKEIKKAKKKHERKIAEDCKENPKTFWKYVQEQTKAKQGISALKDQDGELKTAEDQKADILNDFFTSVYTTDSTEVPYLEECSKSYGIGLSDIVVTPEAVENKLKQLNPTKAQGPDKIPPRVLKELSHELSIPLTHIFNKSLETGKIPDEWKTAVVTAIHKKGSKNEAGNYRPVSLTCVLCKVLESIVRDEIVNHFNQHKLYAECQHGFRNRRSCISQLLEVIEDMTVFLNDGNSIDIVYLDFRKAFDTVPHKRLLMKLKSYGITGKIYQWIEDFLVGRSQQVKVGTSLSKKSEVTSGIPQGSILGPILFTIFINDLPDGLKNVCKIFADDTKIYGNSKESHTIQDDINKLQEWSNRWNLYFNVDKCKVMHIGKNNPGVTYNMMKDGKESSIQTCEHETDLGVTFDTQLNFNKHIELAIGKANKMLGLIRRTFSYMNKEVFTMLYKSLVRPHLEYGNVIWNPVLKRQSISIEKVQRRATKLLKQCKHLPYAERLKYLGLYSLKGRRRRGDLIETYKMFNGFTDTDPYRFFDPATTNVTRNSDKKIFINHYHNKMHKNVFSQRVAPHWNALPAHYKNAQTTNHFKNLLDGDKVLIEHFRQFDGYQ